MINAFSNNIQILLPEILISSSALMALIIGVLNKNLSKLVHFMMIFVLVFAGIVIFKNFGFENDSVNKFFISNKLISNIKLLLIIGTIIILFLASNDIKNQALCFEFSIILILSLIGMMLMISSNDFISMYLGFELQSLCLYGLTAIDRDNANSSEAGIKYFVLGALTSGILLFGISLIYGSTGSTNFSAIESYFREYDYNIGLNTLIGLIMIIIALGFKISAAPFHIWTVDVYQGSPLIVTLFLSTIAKSASLFLLVKILYYVFGTIWIVQWQQIVILMSMLSMLVGSIAALKQDNIKRVLAYSSITHVGYILMAIATGDDISIRYIMIYLIIYIISNAGLFSFLMNFNLLGDLSVKNFKNLAKSCPISALYLSIMLLSLAGIPPMAGFFTKLYIFEAALSKKLYSLSIVAVFATSISAYYYLKIIKIMYFENSTKHSAQKVNFNKINIIVFTAAALINILFFSLIGKVYSN